MLGKGLESLIPPKGKPVEPDATTPASEPSRPVENQAPIYRELNEPPASLPTIDEPKEVFASQPLSSEQKTASAVDAAQTKQKQQKRNDGLAIFHIEVEKIKPNPYQPRREFDEEHIRELATSIRDYGFLQPLVVSKMQKETPSGIEVEYQLIAGERRFLAARMLGLDRVPAIIRHVDENQERLEMAIIENLQRENLNPIEMGRAFSRLQDEFRLTQREIATRLGKSREAVANTMRLLDLPPAIQDALQKKLINETHGRLLLAITDPAAQAQLFDDLLHQRLTTRELKERAREKKPHEEVRESISSELSSFQEKLSSRLGAPVRISESGEGGKITISFYSKEELQSLMERLAEESEDAF